MEGRLGDEVVSTEWLREPMPIHAEQSSDINLTYARD